MPVLPIVAVEVPPDLPAHLAAATVRACDSALGAGQCVIPSRSVDEGPFAWIATVVPDPKLNGQVRVDLRRALRGTAQIRLTRTLSFENTEEELHRWSTVGVVVAALVVSGSQSTNSLLPSELQPDPSSPPILPEPKEHRMTARAAVTATPQPKTNLVRSTALVRLSLAGTFGGSLEQLGSMRVGALLRPSLLLSDWACLWLGIAGSRSREEVVSLVWSGAAGIGFAAVAPGRQIGLEGRLGIRADQAMFHAVEVARSDDDRRLRWGPSAGIDVSLPLVSAIDLLLICEGAILWPRVLIQLRDRRVGEQGHFDGTVGLGLRAWFGRY